VTTEPVWLLDVDGVLNATRPGWGGPPTTRSIVAHGTRWRMRFASQATRAIRELSETVDVRWATTWVDFVPDLTRVFDLPVLPAAFALPGADQPTQTEVAPLKLAAALAVVEEGRRLIWTDDDAIPTDGPDRDRLDAAGALLIAPKPGRGDLRSPTRCRRSLRPRLPRTGLQSSRCRRSRRR
jgi:hypothetical protein